MTVRYEAGDLRAPYPNRDLPTHLLPLNDLCIALWVALEGKISDKWAIRLVPELRELGPADLSEKLSSYLDHLTQDSGYEPDCSECDCFESECLYTGTEPDFLQRMQLDSTTFIDCISIESVDYDYSILISARGIGYRAGPMSYTNDIRWSIGTRVSETNTDMEKHPLELNFYDSKFGDSQIHIDRSNLEYGKQLYIGAKTVKPVVDYIVDFVDQVESADRY